jgi:molybdopterin molybdotransferase
LSIGDELIDPGAERRSGQIYDANRPSLLALLHRLGMETTDCGVVPDRPDSIAMTLERAIANHDAIVASAGVSVGDEDHTRRVAGRLGRLDFSGVAIKPGKPVSFGEIGGVPFFALPGNPAAMLICCMTLAVPGLKRLAGATITAPRSFPVRADFELRRRPGPREFLRCTLHREPEGQILARRFPHGGAGVLSSIAQSDGLIMIEEELGEIPPGLMLPFIPYAELDL